MNTLVDLKTWRYQASSPMTHQVSESLFAKIGMDCIRMVAIVAFAALATLIIGS